MKTPTLKSIQKKYKNAKEVKSTLKGNIIEIDHSKPFKETQYGFYCYAVGIGGYKEIYLKSSDKYAEIISYIEPTTKVRNSVLLQLANNNSYSEEILKKECPKLFDEIKLEIGKWYKHYVYNYNAYVYFLFNGKYDSRGGKCYPCGVGFNTDGNYIDNEKGWTNLKNIELATPQEVETALKSEFEKQNNVKFDYYVFNETKNKLFGCNYNKKATELFNNGKWLNITPTDIITIFQKYGKDELQKYLDKL